MKRILLTIAILASTAQAGQAQQFPHDMVEKISDIGFENKNFTITLTNECIIAGSVVEHHGSQITFEYKGHLCPEGKMVALSETLYFINTSKIK